VATATKMVRADVAQSLNLTTTDFNLDFGCRTKSSWPATKFWTANPRT
jgi:hypothetical protein